MMIRVHLNLDGGIRDGKAGDNQTWERSNHFENISVCREFSALVTDFIYDTRNPGLNSVEATF